jgi:hypothetical protein
MNVIFKEKLVGQAILSMLREVTANSYFDIAPQGSAFPYAVFNLTSAFKTENYRYKFFLEINVFDNRGNNIADIVDLVEKIETKFDNCVYDDENINLRFKTESILPLDEAQTHLKRRLIRFNVIYYQNK